MDSEEKVLICGGADDVRCEEKRKRKHRGIPQSHSTVQLDGNDCCHAVLRPWLGSTELNNLYFDESIDLIKLKEAYGQYLRMSLDNCLSSCPMWLFGIRPEECAACIGFLYVFYSFR